MVVYTRRNNKLSLTFNSAMSMSPNMIKDNDKQEAMRTLKRLEGFLLFQSNNGLLDQNAVEEIRCKIQEAYSCIQNNASQGDISDKVLDAYTIFYTRINAQPLMRRLKYLYAIHIFIYIIVLFIFIFYNIAYDPFKLADKAIVAWSINTNGQPIQNIIKANTVWWGGLGGIAYVLFYLRKNIYELQFSKYYAGYYIAYPISGMAFGLGISIVIGAGFITINAVPSDIVYFSIAFIGGLLQAWALSILNNIAQSIHKPTG